MTTENNEKIITLVENIHRGKVASELKPHKDILLLSLIESFERSGHHENHFLLSSELEAIFERNWRKYVTTISFNSSLIEIPFYYLQGDKLWELVLKPEYKERFITYERITKNRILECVDFARFTSSFFEILLDEESRSVLKQALIRRLSCGHTQPILSIQGESRMNSFVSYLNSLHCTDANSKGALAESQALEPLFCEIQVHHPWSDAIFSTLIGAGTDDGGHVILSGHAGDGKSTLAIELIKRLKNISDDKPLCGDLSKREIIPCSTHEIVVIKDLSEWCEPERDELFDNLISDTRRRYLLISNTGPLFDLFRTHTQKTGKTTIESELLTALDSSQARNMQFGDAAFHIYNLAQMDNIGLAMDLFDRMTQSTKWADCGMCSCHEKCPIAQNIRVLQTYHDRIRERLQRLYYRTYAYGARLTMRQIGAHFAYLMTGGGMTCSGVRETLAGGQTFVSERFSFINRFWGDDGYRDDEKAIHLQAIHVFRGQQFNTQFSPAQEREFWESIDGGTFALCVPEFSEAMSRLQRRGHMSCPQETAHSARRQIRRMAYFLYQPKEAITSFNRFQTAFLNSAKILDYQNWQKSPESFRPRDLEGALFCVLQEQFSGILPPEGAIRDWELYITLNRQDRDIRQSVQLVLRHFKFSAKFDLRMERTGLRLIGKGELRGLSLTLTLPFLDYIVGRKSGELSRGLQLSYRDRLENLMAQILKTIPADDDGTLILLKQGEDGSLSTITVRKNGDRLEVRND